MLKRPHHSDSDATWLEHLQELAISAAVGCGLAHDLFVERFSSYVDSAVECLPLARKHAVLALAGPLDYATYEQRKHTELANYEEGCCSHGLSPDCCPAGCGED